LAYLGKADVGNSFLIGVPLVAISMGIETALLDAVLFRMLLKESGRKQFVPLLIANVFNASIALALGLTWAFHHLPVFEASSVTQILGKIVSVRVQLLLGRESA
jgi:hypothetical protein